MQRSELLAVIPHLRRYARAMLADRTAADDLVQDTLERAWSRFSQWQTGSDLRAWMFGIMHNLRVDQLRRPALPTRSIEEEDLEMPTRATQTDQLAVMDIATALQQLPADQREILLLVALEEMPYAEIAITLGIPIGTVMSRLSRGRERLRLIMDGQLSSTKLRVVK